MHRFLQILQIFLLALVGVTTYLILIYDFGKPVDEIVENDDITVNFATTITLEQMRTWSDLIVQKTVFSPSRGSVKASEEAWAKNGPAFQLVAILEMDGKKVAYFLPNGKDPKTTTPLMLTNGGTLAKDISVVEVKTQSAIIRKSDGLFEMKLPRTAFETKVKLSEQ